MKRRRFYPLLFCLSVVLALLIAVGLPYLILELSIQGRVKAIVSYLLFPGFFVAFHLFPEDVHGGTVGVHTMHVVNAILYCGLIYLLLWIFVSRRQP